jgi:hypothetical protein
VLVAELMTTTATLPSALRNAPDLMLEPPEVPMRIAPNEVSEGFRHRIKECTYQDARFETAQTPRDAC